MNDGLYFGPCLNPGGEPEWTDEQLDHLRAEWERKRLGRPKVLGLPFRVRIRLGAEQAVTDAGIWLCDHRMWWAAGLLWWRR